MNVSKWQQAESRVYGSKDSIGEQRKARMSLIPAGSFLMGSNSGSAAEAPQHVVEVADFWLDQAPVTNREYAEFCDDSGYETEVEQAGSAWGVHEGKYQRIGGLNWRTYFARGREDHPVVLVTWNDAVAYCEWAEARLPTEAEWEKAARGGLLTVTYPWGEEAPDGTQSNIAATASEVPGTTGVRHYAPNKFDLYDMVGNVWQWCSDWYGEQYYAESPASNPAVNPAGATCGKTRVRRGGSWNVIQAFRLRCANRGAMSPSQTATNMGFRCARS